MTATITAHQLFDLVRAYGLEAEVTDNDDVPPLADRRGSDCYPTCTITLAAGDWQVEVIGWKVCWWEKGPNRRDSGEWIGEGWSFLTDTSDGAYSGRPKVRCTYDEDDEPKHIEIVPGAHVGETYQLHCQGLSHDEAEELAIAIGQALDDAYDDWEPEDAEGSEVYLKLTKRGPHHSDAQLNADVTSVHLFASNHAGRPVYAIDEDSNSELFTDAGEAVERAREILVANLHAEIERVEDEDLHDYVEMLERAAGER